MILSSCLNFYSKYSFVEMGVVSKSSSWVRWPVLLLACFMLIGSYYSSEMPAALKKQLDDYFGRINLQISDFS